MLLDVNKQLKNQRVCRWKVSRRLAGQLRPVSGCGWYLFRAGTQSQIRLLVLAQSPNAAPVVITLDEAIHRAQANESNYVSAAANNRISALDRAIARNGLLPGAIYQNQYLYTQGNGLPIPPGTTEPPPRFIANNGVREYISALSVTETIGLSRRSWCATRRCCCRHGCGRA